MMSYPSYGGLAPSRNTVIGSSAANSATPASSFSPPSPNSSGTTSAASRNCLLKVPNAKASRYVDGSSWKFMALGELAVYKVQVASAENAVASLAAKEERAANSGQNGLFSPTPALSPSDAANRKLPPPPVGGFVGSGSASNFGPPPLAKSRSREGSARLPPPITAPRPIAAASSVPPLVIERVPSPVVSRPSVPPPQLSLDTASNAVRTGFTVPSSALERTTSPSPALSANGQSSILFVVRTTEFPLASASTIAFEEPNNYIIDNGVGFCIKIELELPRNGSHSILDNIIRRHTGCGVGTLAPAPYANASADTSAASSPELRPQDFRSQLLLIDESTGKVLGPLNQQIDINEAQLVSAGETAGQVSSQDPVLIQFPTELDGSQAQEGDIKVSPFSDLTSQYGRNNSKIVGAAEYVSRGILFAAEFAGNSVSGAAAGYKKRTKATDSPLVFSPSTKKAVGSVAGTVEGAAGYARRGIGMIGNAAEKAGATAVSYASKGAQELGISSPNSVVDPNSNASRVKGLFKDGMQAVLTVVDGVEKSGKHLLETSRQSTNEVVQHRFGDEARDLTNQITGIGSNVVLVYVDARGVMHRALLKRMGKGAIRARMKDGREVVLDDAGLQGTHTERDEKGNLILVDEKQGDRMQIESIEKLDLNTAGQTLSPTQNGQRRSSTPGSWFRPPVGLTSAIERVPAAINQVHNELRNRPAPPKSARPS